MSVFSGRQHYIYRGQAVSASVLAALLSALLLFSPGTARAVANVLAENGVALPASMVRILETAPLESTQDTLRREEEAITKQESSPKNEFQPLFADCLATLPIPPVAFFVPSIDAPLYRGAFRGISQGRGTRSACPSRAPPV